MPSNEEYRVEYIEGILEIVAWPKNPPISFRHRVLVTGGRYYSSPALLRETLSRYAAQQPISELAAGCATGADEYALAWADDFNVPWRKYRADWNRYTDSAGTKRNIVMLDHFEPDIVIAFVGNTGTLHCIRQARKRGIPRILVEHGPTDWGLDMETWG